MKGSSMQEKELLPHLFRTEYRKIVAVLARYYGLEQLSIAEDIASDTFLTASETWGLKGLPENPVAWLYTVAKNKSRDQLRRMALFDKKLKPVLKTETTSYPETDIDLSEQNIRDSQLQTMFALCDPILPLESQVALTLRILCGFGIDEIADAFLTNRETISKRLTRGKEKLRSANIRIGLPDAGEIKLRIDAVLTSLYLLFNEGYYSSSRDHVLRKDFCLEAMRLTGLLAEYEQTALPHVDALLALMCYHASRFDARTTEKGEIIRYDEQDIALWNSELISTGHYYLNKASRGKELSRYHLEAGIAYWHTIKNDSTEKWESILQFYNQLLCLNYSTLGALNRTYALSKIEGNRVAIAEAEKLGLVKNHLYHVLLGYLYENIDNQKAKAHLNDALFLANTETEKNGIRRELMKLE
jgi:RNA polymerase sigma factor (sigma-70 family)